jgi:hypothetical protein
VLFASELWVNRAAVFKQDNGLPNVGISIAIDRVRLFTNVHLKFSVLALVLRYEYVIRSLKAGILGSDRIKTWNYLTAAYSLQFQRRVCVGSNRVRVHTSFS